MGFSSLVFFAYLSVVVSFFTLVAGLAKRSWLSLLISAVTFLPIVYYFLGGTHKWLQAIWVVPIAMIILAYTFWRKNRNPRNILP